MISLSYLFPVFLLGDAGVDWSEVGAPECALLQNLLWTEVWIELGVIFKLQLPLLVSGGRRSSQFEIDWNQSFRGGFLGGFGGGRFGFGISSVCELEPFLHQGLC